MSNEIIYAIRNISTGAFIHKNLFKIKIFRTKENALRFMRKNGINESVYGIEVIRI